MHWPAAASGMHFFCRQHNTIGFYAGGRFVR
jgi:hypothetical protein